MKFEEWLVGFTDGDGCFSFIETPGRVTQGVRGSWVFKIAQKKNNCQLLYFIKEQLGVGKVESKGDMGVFVVGRKELLIKKVLPVFDRYSLKTKKSLDYFYWKRGVLQTGEEFLNKKEKEECRALRGYNLENRCFSEIKGEFRSERYIKKHCIKNCKKSVFMRPRLSKWWVVGFIEAEGSFYLTKKSGRLQHAFGIRGEKEILEEIRKMFDSGRISAVPCDARRATRGTAPPYGDNSSVLRTGRGKVRFEKNGIYNIEITKRSSIEKIIAYFDGTMKGIKSLEFKIWVRAFRKKGIARELMRKIRI